MENASAIRARTTDPGMRRKNLAICLAGLSAIIAILAIYARWEANQLLIGLQPQPGFHITDTTGSCCGRGTAMSQDIGITVANGEKHIIYIQSIRLIPAPSLQGLSLTFRGRVRTMIRYAAHISSGPWIPWHGGTRWLSRRSLVLHARVGLYLKGAVYYRGARNAWAKKQLLVRPVIALQLRYTEQGHAHERLLSMP